MRAVERWGERKAPFAIVVDTVASELLSTAQRRLLVSAMVESCAKHGNLRACSVVVGSAIMRGVMTAMEWLARPPFSTEVVGTVPDAEAHVRKALSRERRRG